MFRITPAVVAAALAIPANYARGADQVLDEECACFSTDLKDWRSIPADIEVYAKAFIEVTTHSTGPSIHGQVRLFEVSTRDTAVDFGRISAVVVRPGIPPSVQRFESAPLPRQKRYSGLSTGSLR